MRRGWQAADNENPDVFGENGITATESHVRRSNLSGWLRPIESFAREARNKVATNTGRLTGSGVDRQLRRYRSLDHGGPGNLAQTVAVAGRRNPSRAESPKDGTFRVRLDSFSRDQLSSLCSAHRIGW